MPLEPTIITLTHFLEMYQAKDERLDREDFALLCLKCDRTYHDIWPEKDGLLCDACGMRLLVEFVSPGQTC